jgi:KDO2-lipid IV(A) lauroyltransferase
MPLKQQLETILFKGIAGCVRLLPLGGAYRLAEQIALFAHVVTGWRRESTVARVREIFPQKSDRECKQIRLEAVRNLARNATELIRGPETFSGIIEGEDEVIHHLQHARQSGKGVLLVIAHTGNWDLAGTRVTRRGLPMCFIARQQKNTALYAQLIMSRESSGGTVVDRDDPRLLRKLLKFLKEQNGIVAILVDIRSRTPGEMYRFLDHPAPIANGLGLLAAKSGATVVPVYLGRKGRVEHRWKPFSHRSLPVGCKDKNQRAELLQSCLDDLSGEILKNPESYFWFNKRWVLEPFGD